MKGRLAIAALVFLCVQCGHSARAGNWWRPAPGTSWQWQLSGTLDTSVAASVYDIDLFNCAPEQIAALQGQGRRVVCYFDTAWEQGRPDSGSLRPIGAARSSAGRASTGWTSGNPSWRP